MNQATYIKQYTYTLHVLLSLPLESFSDTINWLHGGNTALKYLKKDKMKKILKTKSSLNAFNNRLLNNK